MQYTNLDDFLRDLPVHAAHVADRLRGHELLVLLETKQGRRLYVQLKDGEVQTMAECSREPDCTLSADEDVLMDVICGRLNPAKALLLRRVKVKGDMQVLLSLLALLA